jgi:hypothetical protein
MSNELIVRNDTELKVSFSPEALVLKESALAAGALIGRVTTLGEQECAVNALREITTVVRSVEKARKEIKQPILDYGRAIDDAARKFIDEVDKEEGRISNLISEFQLAERRRLAAELALQQKELQRIEQERAAALVKAKNVEEQTQIMEAFSRKAALESQPIVSTKAEGQVAKKDWEIQITNPYDLAKYHPQCVTITAKLGEIKALLTEGVPVHGITAKEVIRSSVRMSNAKAIDV